MNECPCCGQIVDGLVESRVMTPMCVDCYEDAWDAKMQEYDQCM